VSTTDERRDAALAAVEARQVVKAQDYAAESREIAALNALYDADGDPDRDVVLELAGTARMGQRRASGELSRRTRLVELLPHALAELEAGRMWVATAEILLAGTRHASPAVHLEVDKRISVRLSPLDAADASRLVQRTVVQVEAEIELEAAKERHAKAKANRGLWVMPLEDGMARIGAETDAVSARHFALGMDELDRAQKLVDERNGVKRTKSQRQVDLLTELPHRQIALIRAAQRGDIPGLLAVLGLSPAPGAAPAEDTLPLEDDGMPPEAPKAWELDPDELMVQVLSLPVKQPSVLNGHVGMTTLLDVDQRACLIDGIGYIPAWQARLLLPDASLRQVAVHAETGLPFHVSPTLIPPPDIAGGTFQAPPTDPPLASPGDEPPGEGDPPAEPGSDSGGPPGGGLGPPSPTTPGSSPAAPHEPPAGDPALDDHAAVEEVPPAADVPSDDPARHAARLHRQRVLALLEPVQVGRVPENRYQPSAALRLLVETRDPSCLGVGCPRPAGQCELDHELEFSKGGLTEERNLRPLTSRCHHARHGGWTVVRDPDTGVTTWTSPLGRTYTRLPAWEPPLPLPAPAQLPEPRLEQLPHAEPDYVTDRPLWSEPVPAPIPPPRTTRPAGTSWDNGESPPF
jgi:hypothetical protein